ncbi:MAG TPA: TonB-dependent receptor [Caulobacteraceae bacterium]|jgi:iron complex outermembrane receptor protein|nr:TonB-dependent receptor [Caulobacteraceae bacterium]
MSIHTLAASASLIVLAIAGGAEAQATASGGAPANPPQSEASSVAEVVVTAERRTVNLQQAPIAATVLSGQDLQRNGVFTVDQLQFISPSLTVDNFGQGNDVDIRGIGKGEHNSQTGTGVVTYHDGLASFPGYFQEEPYYDIANVQVLRGPQGTFSGQNATGGAILINSNNPIVGGGYHGYLEASYGNYDAYGVQGAINIPVTDTFAMRLAFDGLHQNSMYHFLPDVTAPGQLPSTLTGDPNLKWGAVRFSALWTPTSQLKVLFKTDYDYLQNGGYFGPPAGDYDPNHLFNVIANGRTFALDQFVRSVLQIDYTTDSGIDFRSISGYEHGRTAWKGPILGTNTNALPNQYYEGSPSFPVIYDIAEGVDETILSQEFNVISPDRGPVRWIAGAYLQKNVYDFPNGQFDIADPATVADLELQGINRTYTIAGFGQLSFELPAGFELQIGARYSKWSTANDVYYFAPEFVAYGYYYRQHAVLSGDNVTGKATLNWKLNDDNFFYAFVSSGAKPGGLNVGLESAVSITPPPVQFGQEYVWDYEGGWKSTLLDGHLRTQLGVFYSRFEHFQVILPIADNPALTTEVNDPNPSVLYGVEAQAQGVFGPLSFNFGLGLEHSQVGLVYAEDPRLPALGTCSLATGPAAVAPNGNCIDLSGKQQPYAPSFTLELGAQYAFRLPNGDTITPHANYSHISSQWATLFENVSAGDYLGARDIFGASIAWNHGGWTLTAYGTNLTNDRYVSAVVPPLKIPGLPRQYGVSVMKTF